MSAQAFSSAAIPGIALLDSRPAASAAMTATTPPLSGTGRAGGADGALIERFSGLMNAADAAPPTRLKAAAMDTPAVQAVRMPAAGVSSLFHGAAASHVALASRSAGNAGAVTQRFIDTMSAAEAAEAAERNDDKNASNSVAGATGPAGAKAGISSLFGKISAMHADLEKRFMDPASYASTAGMLGLQRMTGMYSIYFETLSKSVLKVVRDADTFMKSSA
ncbi:hypothetical protein [Achromobacter aloeverae]|uniref:Uncharacterized protein n=1 Tax=Achromobacter aloeverae TaxID=1750518 RepID=A0A4V1MS03_9BURK|nr:hypothetical protein [Achromobacter aloeverae]RXN87780.1 hypothetical protein C7R54_14365 [Achromobacter aloeverae]